MKSKILLILLTISICFLTSCSGKIISTNQDNYKKYINEFYKYQTGTKNGYVAIDLRELDIYAKGHIKGFISYTYNDSTKENFISYIEGMYDKKDSVFLLDDNVDNLHEAANSLKEAGYKKIYIYLDGYESLKTLAIDSIFISTGTDDCGC